MVGMFILRRRAAFLAHVLGGDARHEPALDVGPGIPRRPTQPLGLAGPLVGRPAWGALGLGLRRPPVFPHIGRRPNRAAWDASLGFQAERTAHTPGPSATLPPLAALAGAHSVTLQAQGGMVFLGPGTGGAVPPAIPAGRHPLWRPGASILGLVAWPGLALPRAPWGLGGPHSILVPRVFSDQHLLRVPPWGPSILAPGSPFWALGYAGPAGLGAWGSSVITSLGRRAPGAPGLEPDGCFAKACTFLRVRGPPARASAMALAAAWFVGAAAHRFVRRSQNRT